MRTALLALTVGLAAPPQVAWQGADVRWTDLSGSAAIDWTNSVIELRDGSVFATGFVNRSDDAQPPSWDLVARKYRADGRLLWSRRIGGAALDAGWVAIETSDGRIAIAGPSASGGAGETDAWLLVLDRDGKTLIDRRYGGAREDFATGIAPAPDGFLLTGWTQSMGAGGRDLLLVRTDAEGRELWRKAHGGPNVDRGFFVQPVTGGYVIAGVTGMVENYDFLLIKLDDRGEIVWRQVRGGPGNDPTHGLSILPDGRILLVGYTQSWGARDYDVTALTFSADGALLRQEMIGGPSDDRAQFSATAPDGTTWITGYTKSFSSGDWDMLVAKVGADGSFEPWLGAIASPADDNGSSVAATRDGDLLLSGYSAALNAGTAPPDGLVMRFDPATLVRRTDGVLHKRVD